MSRRKCKHCGEAKPSSAFYTKSHSERKNPGRTYVRSVCKSCHYKETRRNIVKDPALAKMQQRRSHLKRRFGITPEQYDDLLQKQGGCCAICKAPASRFKHHLHIDHRHAGPRRGEITGLLCWGCNAKLIGKYHDPELFERAAQYLRQGTGWLVPDGQVSGQRRKRRKK